MKLNDNKCYKPKPNATDSDNEDNNMLGATCPKTLPT